MCAGRMILQSLFFTKLLGPYEGPSAWNDNQTYAYTPDEEYGNGAYTEHFTDLWGPKWKHMDNLDHGNNTSNQIAIARMEGSPH